MAELEPQFLEVVSTSALELRKGFEIMQAGAYGAGDLKVTAGAAGRSVDVAAGVGYINGSHVADQGRYRIRNDAVRNSDAFVLGGIPANTSGLSRLDQIIARIYDHTHDNSGQRKWQLEVLPGTPASGVTLDNRTGFTALPLSSLLVADLITPNGATSILPGNIRDRRTWARGLNKVAFGVTSGPSVSTSTAIVIAEMTITAEFSGVPCEALFSADISNNTANQFVGIELRLDGVSITGQGDYIRSAFPAGANLGYGVGQAWPFTPTAGRHTVAVYFWVAAGIGSAQTTRRHFRVHELLSQNADNL